MAQVFQVVAAGINRGDLVYAFGRAKGEELRSAVDAGMREPGFCRTYKASCILGASLLGQTAHDVRNIFIPRKRERSGGEIGRAGKIEEGREQIIVADFAGVFELRNGEELHVRRSERVRTSL
jgi:hypothetical protein